jgi:hypothetical protein
MMAKRGQIEIRHLIQGQASDLKLTPKTELVKNALSDLAIEETHQNLDSSPIRCKEA